jgi:hypothetical protein
MVGIGLSIAAHALMGVKGGRAGAPTLSALNLHTE